MAALRRFASGAALLLALARGEEDFDCTHCNVGESFEEFLKPDVEDAEYASDVHLMWPTHVEVIPLTTDVGGWLPPSFNENIAKEAIKGWRDFQDIHVPKMPKDSHIRHQMGVSRNDAFFTWQKEFFENGGIVQKGGKQEPNTSWPEMNGLPEYQKLRQIVDKMSRRYLTRSGLSKKSAKELKNSIFNWAAIHGAGEFHGPHTHVGEYHVAVFYAQVGNAAGKIRFGDPRGHSPPFGRSLIHTPKAGHLVMFPSWLSHMATVTAPEASNSGGDDPYRVIFSFNIGPEYGPLPCHKWWSDPTGDMRFQRKSKIDPKALGL